MKPHMPDLNCQKIGSQMVWSKIHGAWIAGRTATVETHPPESTEIDAMTNICLLGDDLLLKIDRG
jgi:hypothetical protein